MRRCHLGKVYYKSKSEKSFEAYKKQKKFYTRLYRKQFSIQFYFSINLIRPLLLGRNYSGKQLKHSFKTVDHNLRNCGLQIKFFEKDEVLQDNDLIAKELNKFFKNVVSALNIKDIRFITKRSSDGITDSIDKAIDRYKFHPSIVLIQKHLKNRDVYSFKRVEIGDIEKEINNIYPNKATTTNSIPPKILVF